MQMLADASTTAAPTTAPADGLYSFLHGSGPLLIMVVIVWAVLFILPKRRQDKSRQSMLNTMKRGDEIQTIGGIIGKVVEAKEDRVLVKVDESSNTKMWFLRSAISRVIVEDSKAAAATTTPSK
jgi:preprotein translocase subunit YajC